jgi:hypothetical protein
VFPWIPSGRFASPYDIGGNSHIYDKLRQVICLLQAI